MASSAWGRWWALDPWERALRLRALVVLFAVRVLALLLPFRRACALLATGRGGGTRRGPEAVDRAVRSASRFVPGASCLVRALAAKVLLGRGARLVLGVRREGERGLEAHAWVECAHGTVVGDRGESTMVPVPILEDSTCL